MLQGLIFIRFRFFTRRIFPVLLIILGYIAKGADMTLNDAIKKGLVKAGVTGNPNDTSSNFISRYYGPCLQLSLQSLYTTTLTLCIESGLFLETTDSCEQRMMLTHDELGYILF